MNRSPYHLTAHAARPDSARRRKRTQIGSSTIEPAGSRQAQHVGLSMEAGVVNPMVRPNYGAYASRYISSRSMGVHAAATAIDPTPQDNCHELPTWTHVHPLQQQGQPSKKKPVRQIATQSQFSQPQGLSKNVLDSLQQQFYKVLVVLKNTDENLRFISSGKSSRNHRVFLSVVVPVLLLLGFQKTGLLPAKVFGHKWVRMEGRALGDRQCVMNLFVDKQKPDEWNPDYVDPKKVDPKKPQKSIKVEGTHRTKGQLKLINRWISGVADSFRSNIKLKQHIVFLGARDGGHLANTTLLHWPARGEHRTQVHVFADEGEDQLQHEHLESVENWAATAEKRVHIYDWNGNTAGSIESDDSEEEDDDLFGGGQKKWNHRRAEDEEEDTDITVREEFPELKELLFDAPHRQAAKGSNDDDDDNEETSRSLQDDSMKDTIIPYVHVDGISFKRQIKMLTQIQSLLETRKVVVVGIEHSPDMDMLELIQFFNKMKYKTFMLGLRQLTRIDNLCPEILSNIVDHPFLDNTKKYENNFIVNMLKSSSTSAENFTPTGDAANLPRYPPFFIALPKGRLQKEEMTIQHMYDLFSGEGGGGQVKTANDRKAPGK